MVGTHLRKTIRGQPFTSEQSIGAFHWWATSSAISSTASSWESCEKWRQACGDICSILRRATRLRVGASGSEGLRAGPLRGDEATLKTKRLESAFGGNLNESAAAVLGKMNGAAHEMNGTLQQFPEEVIYWQLVLISGRAMQIVCQPLDELLQEFSVTKR